MISALPSNFRRDLNRIRFRLASGGASNSADIFVMPDKAPPQSGIWVRKFSHFVDERFLASVRFKRHSATVACR